MKDVEFKMVFCFILILLVISVGINIVFKQEMDARPSFYARLCKEDSCFSVNFWGQEDFIKYCEEHKGWYQISATTTCAEGKK